MPDFKTEKRLVSRNIWPIAGIDEAGRGPLAGPVAAAAVILHPSRPPRNLDDSKKLSAAQRDKLFDVVMDRAIAVGVAFASVEEIDRLNIRQATHLAMRRALAALAITPAYALVDGCETPSDLRCASEAIVAGDSHCLSIAAASIVAKVARDRLMRRLAERHPQYGFERHMGYGTRAHFDALRAHGPCRAHRKSFSLGLPTLAERPWPVRKA